MKKKQYCPEKTVFDAIKPVEFMYFLLKYSRYRTGHNAQSIFCWFLPLEKDPQCASFHRR